MPAWPRRGLARHPNTVSNRVMAGVYRAEKIDTHDGPTWMIESDSLTTTGDSKQVSGSDGPVREPEPLLRGKLAAPWPQALEVAQEAQPVEARPKGGHGETPPLQDRDRQARL